LGAAGREIFQAASDGRKKKPSLEIMRTPHWRCSNLSLSLRHANHYSQHGHILVFTIQDETVSEFLAAISCKNKRIIRDPVRWHPPC
jgi:hypothetical protein